MAKVKAYVHVLTTDGSGYLVLAPGDTVPDGVTVTNPAALEAPAEEKKAPARRAKKDDDSE